ncbi:MAG: hypothetical protein WBA10_12510 [Elainellaceae cyanobacterium]
MTFLYPDQPSQPEAAPNLLTTPPRTYDGEIIRHIVIGSPEAVRDAIYVLHNKRYADQALWTKLIPIGEAGVRITPNEGQVLSYLMRPRSLDVPTG